MNKKLLILPIALLLAACGKGTEETKGPNDLQGGEQNGSLNINGGLTKVQVANALKDAGEEILTIISNDREASMTPKSIKRSIDHKHEVDFEQANEVTVAPLMVYMAGRLYEQSFYKPCEEVITWTNELTQSAYGMSIEVDMTLTFHAEANPDEGKIYVAAYQTLVINGELAGENIPSLFDIGYDFEMNSLTDYAVYSGRVDEEGNVLMGFASYEGGKYYHDNNDAESVAESTEEGNKILAKLDAVLALKEHVATESEKETLVDIYLETQQRCNEMMGIESIVTTKR